MKKIEQGEAGQLLDKLAQQIVDMYDGALDAMASYHKGANPSLAETWKRLLDKQPESSARRTKVMQMALETLLHDILFCLQEQREFRIQAMMKDGEWINIDEYSDGVHGDLFEWLERKSKYGCVTNEFVRMRMEENERSR